MSGTQPGSRPAPTVVVLCTAGLLLSSPPAFALNPSLDLRQYGHSSWLARTGFVKGTIRALAQTSDGYLWLGSDVGLARFDGVRMVPWTPPSGQRLPSTIVNALLAARDGTLWIGTFRGLVSWRNGQLTHYAELADQQITDLLEDRTGAVWAGSSAGPAARLCAFRSGTPTCFGEDGTFGDIVWSLTEDGAGTMWVLARTGLWRWTPGGPSRYGAERFEAYFQSLTRASGPNGVTHAHAGRVREIVPGVRSGEPLRGLPSAINVTDVFRDRDGALWVGTDAHGVLRVYDGRVSVFTSVNGLSSDHVTELFEDREGTMWVATADGFDSFRHLPIVSTDLTDASARKLSPVSIVATRDGSLWIGSDEGLHRWRNGDRTIYRTRTHPALPDDRIQSLFEDERGRVWVTGLRGLAMFDNGAFTRIPTPHLGYVFALTGDGDGGVWVSSFDQGVLHVAGGRVVQRLSWEEIGGKGVGSGLASDTNGGVWIAMTGGLLAYVRDGNVRRRLTTQDGLGEPLVNVQADADGAIWATTELGFTRIVDGHLATMTTANGLPCNEGHWIVADDAGAYWLLMRCGLVRIARTDVEAWAANPQRKVVATTYDFFDGARLFAFNRLERPQVSKSTDGCIWLIFPGTLAVLDPVHLPTNSIAPSVHVEQITADGTAFQARPGLRLPPLVRDLQVDYTALSLVVPEKNQFRVMLEGRDIDWQDVGTRRQAFYTDLGPGSYRFRVKGSNNSGVWNEDGATLEFAIAPAYYQTRWFATLVVASVFVVLWAGYRVRVREVARDYQRRLDERVNERTRIARELHDTLLQSFHGLLLRFQTASYLLPSRPAEAKDKLDTAIEQAARAITEGRDAVQGLRASTVERNDLAVAIRTLGDELVTDTSAQPPPTFRVTVEGQPRDLHPILRDDIYKIAAEALRNAFRHAHAGRVEVEIRYDDEQFRLRVRDDGKGIGLEVLASQGIEGHYGLRGMPERAALIGGKLAVWSEVGVGTEVELRLPANNVYATSRRRSWVSRLFASRTPA
jgi:signal transduction histidine kinase/ligand-binding sensor domain-containing protein